MSLYFVKGRGWRYDFTLKGTRHTGNWFKTKKEARGAEAKRKEELTERKTETVGQTQTDMSFLEMVNRKLDHVKAYNSASHYRDYRCLARRWIKRWGDLPAEAITQEMIQQFVLERREVSPYVGNMEVKCLRATFNFAKKRKWLSANPLDGIEMFPVEKRVKYVPPSGDIDKVIAEADPATEDYLWVLRETMGRMSEINRLTWDDVNLEGQYVVLYTRKKRGGHLTPRKVWMTEKLLEVLSRRYTDRDKEKPWVFWHTYWSSKTGKKEQGPYQNRTKFMKTLCRKAGVRYFRFHPLRHSGASIMDNNNVPIGAIQRILGHENRTTTEIYLHSIGQAEREAMSIYERARKKSHTDSHTEQQEVRSHDPTPCATISKH